ncbi:MAG: putative dsRNA-binding protein, partial [Bacillota bacterium]
AHDRHFAVEVRIGVKPMARGEGGSKKAAEQAAARIALGKAGKP